MPAALTLNGQQFSDFNFTWSANFGPGIYALIGFGSSSGSLGANTSGTIDGYPATLAVQGNDLVVNVVPEPSTAALLGPRCGADGLGVAAGDEERAMATSRGLSAPPASAAACAVPPCSAARGLLLFFTASVAPVCMCLFITGTDSNDCVIREKGGQTISWREIDLSPRGGIWFNCPP